MRLRVLHKTVYTYDQPASSVIQLLRLTPRDHEGQRVRRWRIDLDQDAQLRAGEDAFGNLFHMLSMSRLLDDLAITVTGEVDTHDTQGVVRATHEPFPPGLFLRETMLTQPDEAIRAFAFETASDRDPLSALHALLGAVHGEFTFDVKPTGVDTTATEAFKLRHGVCQDLAHVFIAAARCLNIPARYIGGYMFRSDGALNQEAGHAWAEAYVPDLGWIGFDPANGISPTDAHIRVSVGLDYLGASPVRGSRYGGTAEAMKVAVAVDQAAAQPQN